MMGTAVRRPVDAPVIGGARAGIRSEIQALRAVAVAAVVVYHVWPHLLPGGFVGVDVFFVVSGFLITQHIVAEIERTGRLGIVRFWARRARRLLPAALLVLAASLALTLVVVPATRWQQTLVELAASASYVENWVLAVASVDYLDAENDPSIAQHYWSLSVEEQFYILWPLIIVLLLAGARWATRAGLTVRSTRRVLFAGLGLIAAVSLAHSVLLTAADPGIAYFATSTRAWEFAAGGLLALAGSRIAVDQRPVAAAALAWAGFGAIAISTVVITGETPFPGSAAILPVVGTVLVIAAGRSTAPWAPTRSLENRPVQLLGDISYSVYLWHWPLVIAYPFLRGGEPGALGGLALIAATIVLAGITKRYVEDPLRRGDSILGPARRAIGLAVVGALVFGAAAVAGSLLIERQTAAAQQRLSDVAECAGLRAFGDDVDAACLSALDDMPVAPTLAGRAEDTADVYSCYVPEGGEFTTCRFGDENAAVRLALRGDSHAASLLPGLRDLVEREGWLLDTYYGFGCQLAARDSCGASDQFAAAIRDGDYDAVIATGTRRWQPDVDALADYWAGLMEEGIRVLPVVDVPSFPTTTNECVESSGGDPALLDACVTPRAEALEALPDRYGPAAQKLGIPYIDFTEILCVEDGCPAAIGGVLLYRDSPASHLTATFSRSMSDAWEEILVPLVTDAP